MAITIGVSPVNNTLFNESSKQLTLNSVAVGHTIVVGCSIHNTATLDSVAINGESNATLGTRADSGSVDDVQMGYLSNVTAAGTKTITFTFSGILFGTVFALALNGADTAGALDVANTAVGTGTTASLSLSPATANACIVAMACGNGGDLTQDTGYTLITLPNANWYHEAEYNLDVGAAGVKTVQMTNAGMTAWSLAAMAFKVAGGAALPSPAAFTPHSAAMIGRRYL